jgi:hypothetical protein
MNLDMNHINKDLYQDSSYGFKCTICNKPVMVPPLDPAERLFNRFLATIKGYRYVSKGPWKDKVANVVCEICDTSLAEHH